MWLNCSRTHVRPEGMPKVMEILASEASLAPLQAAHGFCAGYVVESTETPGELISITVWESAEEGQAYLASPECQRVVESVQKYLVAPLERQYYEMYLEVAP